MQGKFIHHQPPSAVWMEPTLVCKRRLSISLMVCQPTPVSWLTWRRGTERALQSQHCMRRVRREPEAVVDMFTDATSADIDAANSSYRRQPAVK